MVVTNVDPSVMWPQFRGGGWFELSDGSKVRGQKQAMAAQAELEDPDTQDTKRRNRDACARSLGALRSENRLEDVDEALVAAVETMAAWLDLDPSNAQLWKQYRETWETLTGVAVESSELTDALQALADAGPKVAA